MKISAKTIFSKFLAIVLVPLTVYVIFTLIRPQAFLNPSLPYTILQQSISNIVLAWGMSFSMMIGNMDFSCVAERIFGAIVGVTLCNMMGPIGLIIGVVLVGVVVGVIKALLMSALDVKNRVITIAYTLVLGSLGYFVTNGDTSAIDLDLGFMGTGTFRMIVFVVLGVVMYMLSRYSLFGAQCRALAGNEAIALSAGIKKKRVEGIATLVCSAFIAVSGMLAISRGGGITPQSGLTSMGAVFSAMSGVFVANALSRFISLPIGIIVGNYTMSLIVYGLIACNLPSQLTTTVNGGFLLGLLLIIEIKNAREEEKNRRAALSIQAS